MSHTIDTTTNITLPNQLPPRRPQIFGMNQPQLDTETERNYRSYATEKYPDLTADAALLAYIHAEKLTNIFFPNAAGERCIFREEIEYKHGKSYAQIPGKFQECVDPFGRLYLIMGRCYSLKAINARRFRAEKSRPMRHVSERRWNRPVGHQHHFLEFPLDIQLVIFGFALATSETLSPTVVTSNWKRQWSLPGLNNTVHYTMPIPRHDRAGAYTELRPVTRPTIDACLLRVSKVFHERGTQILYSNEFRFSMIVNTLSKSPPTMYFHRKRALVRRPSPRKPAASDDIEIARGMAEIENCVHFIQIRGWVYYDHLLRFIYNIGVENAAVVKKLELEGHVLNHECGYDCECFRSGQDLIPCLEIYMPFIVKFLPSLRKLTLNTWRDGEKPHFDENDEWVDPHVARLRAFIRGHLPEVKGLTVLRVKVDGEDHPAFKDDIEWFVERERQQVKEREEASGNSNAGVEVEQ